MLPRLPFRRLIFFSLTLISCCQAGRAPVYLLDGEKKSLEVAIEEKRSQEQVILHRLSGLSFEDFIREKTHIRPSTFAKAFSARPEIRSINWHEPNSQRLARSLINLRKSEADRSWHQRLSASFRKRMKEAELHQNQIQQVQSLITLAFRKKSKIEYGARQRRKEMSGRGDSYISRTRKQRFPMGEEEEEEEEEGEEEMVEEGEEEEEEEGEGDDDTTEKNREITTGTSSSFAAAVATAATSTPLQLSKQIQGPFVDRRGRRTDPMILYKQALQYRDHFSSQISFGVALTKLWNDLHYTEGDLALFKRERRNSSFRMWRTRKNEANRLVSTNDTIEEGEEQSEEGKQKDEVKNTMEGEEEVEDVEIRKELSGGRRDADDGGTSRIHLLPCQDRYNQASTSSIPEALTQLPLYSPVHSPSQDYTLLPEPHASQNEDSHHSSSLWY